MTRIQKLKLNSFVSILSRLIIIFSGLILPRLTLSYFGAETHGLVTSINQFLGIITFLDLGVGAVVKAALYNPLASKDSNQVSKILNASQRYFQKIAYILVLYVLVLIFFYPSIIDSTQSYLSTGLLIIALAISKFGQYYFGVVNELLLSANQQDYIQLISEIIVVILNLLISFMLMYLGCSIQIVKLVSGLIYLLRPLFLNHYVKRNFNINYNIEVKEDPIPQKWNGLGQHIAYSIQNNTDVVILTFFSTLEKISIYSVYNLVTHALSMLISSLTTGIQSFFGELYAKDEINLLDNYFNRIEWIIHTTTIYLYGITAILINPFVYLYTSDVKGISYEAPFFSLILVTASLVYTLRAPYNSMILAAGHFKETQRSSFIEAGLNILISCFLVGNYGLIGVAIGTLVSMIYRTLYLVCYLSSNILYRSVTIFIRYIIIDVISFILMLVSGLWVLNLINIYTFTDWIIVAVVLGVVNLVISITINFIFFKELMISALKSFLS
ncbi:sugar isomerase [Ruoffia tabacinasalis]|uniref:lipopolysaccharide biosynthesis protein n=1 Tax=Ruoffia tabacinasalis TaxID=87458 RepID=UPI003F9E4095